MNFCDEVVTDCVIVGGGALGVLLADALSCSSSALSGRIAVTLFQRTSVFASIQVWRVGANGFSDLGIHQFCGSPRDWLTHRMDTKRRGQIIFLCVPPEATESVFSGWIEAIASLQTRLQVQFVFCNNGLLSPLCHDLINDNVHVHSFVRAIFFVGARREVSGGNCYVYWSGGDAVCWSGIPSHGSTVNEAMQLWTGFRNSDPPSDNEESSLIRVGFLQWQKVESAHKLEREKFFTNFILAAVIGPHMQPNKTVFAKLSGEALELLAAEFAILWNGLDISKESLLENLHATVSATAENYNSLSLQGANGKNSTMKYFFRILNEELSQQRLPKQLSRLTDFIDTSAKNWGVTA